jgi:signal transduction histidine kinase
MNPSPDTADGRALREFALGPAELAQAARIEREVETVMVLDSLHMHIALLDAHGNIVAINRAWQLFGLANGASPQQANSVGTNYLDVCGRACQHADCPQADAARAGIAAVLAGAEAHFELEYPCDSPNLKRWFLMRATPLLGPRRGVVVTHEDITKRWQLEQQRATLINELLAANRELSDFAYVVSHDLKAPLRGISSLASWLVSDYGDKLGGEGREHLNLIASRVKRLSGLIDAILAYSRAGRSREEKSPVALDPLVHNIIDLLAPPPHIQVEIARPLPQLTIEAAKVQQVFQNLLSNAIDFMDKPAGRVVVDCQREGAHWHFTVADNGPGIEARHFERIFHLFQTLSSRDEVERTGVGLALVKKIVELEGGSVWLQSEVGVGTTFHFTLADAAAGPSH